MSEPTSGPWRACHDGDCQCGMIWGPHDAFVAVAQGPWHKNDVTGWDCLPTKEAQQANAKLVAASPDLLAACERFVQWFGGLLSDEQDEAARYHVERMRAAIAKARGVP